MPYFADKQPVVADIFARYPYEVYRNRPNVSLGLDITRNMQIKAYSLDGTVHYGLSFALIK